jgi:hypothetical protein
VEPGHRRSRDRILVVDEDTALLDDELVVVLTVVEVVAGLPT